MMEGLKAVGMMLLGIVILWLAYEVYLISYTGANPFQ